MNSLLDWFTNYCISNALISKDNEALFRYGLEKRLCTLVVLIPFAVIAIYLSGLWTAISYIISFFYLRSQTNGYHAKTHWGCFVGSLLLELLFLMVIKPMLNTIWVLVLVSLASLAVFLFAPYNHPMMNLDDQEYAACKKAARIYCPSTTETSQTSTSGHTWKYVYSVNNVSYFQCAECGRYKTGD